MNKRIFLLAAGLVLAITLDGLAAAKPRSAIHIDSSAPASIFLDGEQVGETPLTLSSLAPGKHTLEAVALGSGEAQVESLVIPKTVALEKTVHFDFRRARVAPRVVVAPRPVVVVRPPPRLVYAPAPRYSRPHWRHGRRWW